MCVCVFISLLASPMDVDKNIKYAVRVHPRPSTTPTPCKLYGTFQCSLQTGMFIDG